MKALKAILLCAIMYASTHYTINAQVTSIFHEIHGVDLAGAGYTTYRIFAQLQDEDDVLVSVYADDDDYLLLGSSSNTVYNSWGVVVTGDSLPWQFCGISPSICYDSFVTIGWFGNTDLNYNSFECGNPVEYASSIPSALEFENSFDAIGIGGNLHITEGYWTSEPEADCVSNGMGIGANLDVLIAQVTIPSNDDLIYNFNTLVYDGGDPNSPIRQVGDCNFVNGDDLDGSTYGFHFPIDPLCGAWDIGCTDSLAINYCPICGADNGTCVYAPSNNSCENAIELAVDGSVENVINVEATPDGPLPASWEDESVDGDVWFSFVAPSSGGTLRIETSDDETESLVNTQLAVYDDCGGLIVGDDEDLGQMYHACVIFSCENGTALVEGETYLIQLDGFEGEQGSCLISITMYDNPGCMDVNALNYVPCASVDDGSCVYEGIIGCTIATACNFDPLAEFGYETCCFDNCIYLEVGGGSFDNEISWALIDSEGESLYQGTANEGDPALLCVPNDCYTFMMYDSFSDSWNGAGYTFFDNEGVILYSGTHNNGPSSSASIGIPFLCGCTDELALNYDSEAAFDDGSCLFPPANDECENAIPIEGFDVAFSVSNVGASPDGLSGLSWVDNSADNDVWLSFVAPYDGGIIVIETSADGSQTLEDTQIALYDACGGTLLDDDDDAGEGLYSEMEFDCDEGTGLSQGQTYFIQLDGFGGEQGTCLMTVSIVEVWGCIYPDSENYDPCATHDNCDEWEVGCLDPTACNYDSGAVVDDGSCVYPPCVTADGDQFGLQANQSDVVLVKDHASNNGELKSRQEDAKQPWIRLYPNPNNGEWVNVGLNNFLGEMISLIVTDAYGKRMYERNVVALNGNTKVNIPANDFAPGVYHVVATTSDSRTTMQLIILE